MQYTHLGIFSDLVAEAKRQSHLFPSAAPGVETQSKVREALGFCNQPEFPFEVRIEGQWEKDGLFGEEVSWGVGYGPRTHAWFFKPVKAKGLLPAVLALHDHGGFKYYGKEKIAERPGSTNDILQDWYKHAYGGRAWVNALAQRGFAVLVHDTFLWGSRKFPRETMEGSLWLDIPSAKPENENDNMSDEINHYNFWALHHEHLVAKYLNLLGTNLAGVVAHEDRIALNYLLSRPEIQPESVACMGLSGGGNRAALLRATANQLKAAVIVGLMSTYEELLDHNVTTHTWMFFPSNWARYGDWPDLAACQAPSPLLVQYDIEDDLFTLQGMQKAHKKLIEHYQNVGNPDAYTGQFYPGPHKFDLEMQEAAFDWLEQWL